MDISALRAGAEYVLKRKRDGKYLEVWGWSVKWGDDPRSPACPIFRSVNLLKGHGPQWHVEMHERFTGAEAKAAGEECEFEEKPAIVHAQA